MKIRVYHELNSDSYHWKLIYVLQIVAGVNVIQGTAIIKGLSDINVDKIAKTLWLRFPDFR